MLRLLGARGVSGGRRIRQKVVREVKRTKFTAGLVSTTGFPSIVPGIGVRR